MKPVDTSPEARKAAQERWAETRATVAEAEKAAHAAWVASNDAQHVLSRAKVADSQAYQAARVLDAMQAAMPGTAVRREDQSYAWRMSDGMPRYLPHPSGRPTTAQSTSHLGPGPELEAWLYGGRKWRPVAEVRPHQQVSKWRVKQ
jgi:hypothetical protein